MVLFATWDNRPVRISVKHNCLTISVGEPAEASVFSYDYAGRLWTAYLNGISYRRGLDGKILAKWHIPGQARKRQWLYPEEAAQVETQAHQTIMALYEAIQSGLVLPDAPLPPQGRLAFERAAAFDPLRSRADAEHYLRIYKPIGILPPDCYLAIVLQATEGCSFNTCTFCGFYRDRPFRIKPPEEFRSHARAVRDFLGDGLSLRRAIFLADANALALPMTRLMPLMDAVHEVYDVRALGGIYGFLDGFSGEKKSLHDYRVLADRGLSRVYVGLETGNAALLSFLRKPGKPEDAIRAVRLMKEASIAVGVIVLLGVGGQQYAEGHIQDTIEVISAMSLGNKDIVYFSELVVDEGLEYAREAFQAGLTPLSHQECVEQSKAIRDALRFDPAQGRPYISRYDIREFVY